MKLPQTFSAIVVSLALGSFVLAGCESDSSGSKDQKDKAESVEAKQQADKQADKQGSAAESDDSKSDESAGNGKLADAPDQAKVGKTAPNFTLTDTAGNKHTLSEYVGDKMIVLEWTSPECPYVQRHYKAKTMQQTLEKLGGSDDVTWFAVNSNKGEAEVSKKWKKKHGLDYPVLIDEEGKVGKTYGAKTTPHMYIIDKEGTLRYNGAIDNDKRGEMKDAKVTNFVLQAGKALKNGESIDKKTTDPYGCSVKYDG